MNESSSSQRVLLALKEARARLEAVERDKNERIAIIGMSGRFPGAKNIDEFWQNLCDGISSIDFLSDDELLNSGIAPNLLKNPNYVRAYSSFEKPDYFDASFFGYSPREAEIIDPQHRIFLECAWEALEHAGYDCERYQGSVGVYAGAALNSYLINLYSNQDLRETLDNVQVVISNVMGLMPTRVSYKLNLTGPSCGIQTGCSTSLVAVHLAVQSLLNRECDMALAGGITINSVGKSGYLYQSEGIASPDGYCRAFDADAQGTVFGNGVGIVVLKRLSEALADGDSIYAIIKGSAINNDGSEKVGLTAPSVTGQAEVIETALKKAGITPETINYVETHGTGTPLGDPIEIASLNKVFQKYEDKKQETKDRKINGQKSCAIASVKPNIGHLDAAAGIAGLIKTVLSLKHQQIPPSLNFNRPNPQIDFDNSPFYVNTQLKDWVKNGTPRRAAVSSFGMGGTNAHVILEEAPTTVGAQGLRPNQDKNYHLLILSAKTQTALETATSNLAHYLQQHPDINLADMAYTLQIGRAKFDYRRIVVAQNIADSVQALLSSNCLTQFQPSTPKSVAFLFSGQGSQYINMARELYETELIFREQVDSCCELLKPHLGLDLREILYPEKKEEKNSLEQTVYAQPALFIVEYALAKQWISWGIQPQAMIGHSIGEYVAACLAGVFSLEDALKLVTIRGQLMQKCPPGAMLSVALSEDEIQPLLEKNLVIAAINAPELCVISGTIEAIDELEKKLTEKGVTCRKLQTSHAFHSPMMESILIEFAEQVSKISLNSPQIPFISNFTGTWIRSEEATDSNYWTNHLRQTVYFAAGITKLLEQPNQILLEIGPGRTLSTFAQLCQQDITALTSLHHPKEPYSDVEFILNTLGKLWLAGGEIDWQGFYSHQKRQRIALPTYPFEGQRYWIEPQLKIEPKKATKKPEIADWFYLPSWKRSTLINFSSVKQQQCWLILGDEVGLGTHITNRLQQENQVVITVKIGNDFLQEKDNTYIINPSDPQDYDLLIQYLQASGKIPDVIAHLWGYGENYPKEEDLNFYSLLFLVQSLNRQEITTPIEIGVISSDIHDVLGTENLNPAKTKVLGLCKVIPQEFPHLICRHIDIEFREKTLPKSVETLPAMSLQKMASKIIEEFNSESTDTIIAYRDHHRWIQSYEPISLPEVQPRKIPLRKQGVYLIVGDLIEGLGLVYAKYLAQTLEAQLILIGRTSLPKKEKWDAWLGSHGPQDEISGCIRKLQALETAGTEFLFFNTNLGNQAEIQAIIEESEQHFGQIHGVIHCGTMGDRSSCSIQELTPTKCGEIWHSKIRGLQILETVLQGKPLDFYLLQSSLSSVVGGVGFAAYAGANLFMDAFANQQTKKSSISWFSINWDACQLEETNPELTGVALLDLAMTPAEVWEVSQRVMAWTKVPQTVISPTDLQTRIDESLKSQTFSKPEPALEHIRTNLSTPYLAPRNEIEQKIAEALQELLGIEKVGIHDNFFELGGHSLLAIQAVSRLREIFQVQLPMREFLFESPTVAGIAKIISENQSTDSEQQAIAELLEQVENLSSEDIQIQIKTLEMDQENGF